MIMAGASCDDIFVIVLFTTFLSMAQGGSADIIDFVMQFGKKYGYTFDHEATYDRM